MNDCDDDELCIGFAFQNWLDPQMFTKHSSKYYKFDDLQIEQGQFVHNNDCDMTGAVVWDDAVMLTKFLIRNVKFDGMKVLEFGAGTGFLGCAIGKFCKPDKVFISDRDVMGPLICKNIQLNSLEHVCQYLDHSWGTPFDNTHRGNFDIIIGSGCIYHQDVNEPLVRSIVAAAKSNAKIYFAIDFRFDVSHIEDGEDSYISPTIKHFLDAAQKHGVSLRRIENLDVLSPEEIKGSVILYEGNVMKHD